MDASDQFEREMLCGAAEGDAEAGLAVLRLCRNGLDHGDLSPALRHYLAERLNDVLDGVPLARALCIEHETKGGRPRDPFPEWQEHLGAFAAALAQRGYKPQQIAVAMCDARAEVHDLPLEEYNAHRIRKRFEPMQHLDMELLELRIGPYCKKLADFPALT